MKQWKFSMNQTTFTMTPAGELYMQYCFGPYESAAESACVGYLQGDFGVDGGAFYTDWRTHRKSLLTGQFQQELKNVILALRKNGLLENRKSMAAHLNRFPEARLGSEYEKAGAFCIKTQGYIFFLRCIPGKSDYSFYLYGYERESMKEVMRKQQGLPDFCWSVVPSTQELVVIRYGKMGYYRQKMIACESEESRRMADTLNARRGITKQQVAAMEFGSMFGWYLPGADPKRYEIQERFSGKKQLSDREAR